MLLQLSIRLLICTAIAVMGSVALAAESSKLRIVGGLASGNQYPRYEEPFWAKELARLSNGRYSAAIVPFDRAGVPGPEMLGLIQLGVVPFGTVLMTTMAAQYPQYTAADLPGLNPDIASLRSTLAAFRPYLEQTMREQHGIEPLAIYIYPAQVLFCKKLLTRLADLSGRHVRVSSPAQADFISALGAVPVHMEFAQIYRSLESGSTDCAVTGAISGHTLGLYRVTKYLYPLSLNWGMSMFGANQAAWNALPADLRELLLRELPKLEATIWAASERDSIEGVACNSGAVGCSRTEKGRMTVVPVSPQDERLRGEIFTSVVLKHWLKRCRMDCAGIWRRTIGPVRGVPISPGP